MDGINGVRVAHTESLIEEPIQMEENPEQSVTFVS